MIRRILHAELSDVRALATDVRRRVSNVIDANVYLDVQRYHGCAFVGPGSQGWFGGGYALDLPDADNWPDGAHLLTIGRVTLAAWGGRPS